MTTAEPVQEPSHDVEASHVAAHGLEAKTVDTDDDASHAMMPAPDFADAPQDVERGPIDVVLLVTVMALIGLGMLAVYTGSSWRAAQRFGDSMIHVRQQMMGAGLGVIALLIANRVDFRWYRNLTRPLLGLTVILLVLTLVPGIGVEINGARRWINLGVMHFQPAELAKVTVCIFMAYSLEKRSESITKTGAFLGHGIALSVLILPLILQPDFGSSVIVTSIVGVMLFLAGARWMHLVAAAAVLGIMGLAAVFTEGYRSARVKTWFDPWADQADSSWQLINAWVALARGGLSGTGFGEGFSMFGYVPEMHNDFVAAVIAEEFGWIGFVVLVALFGIIGWRGYRIAGRCKDVFGSYLAYALTTLVVGQAAVNFGVVTGLLPTKGLTLPFVSFGRSSLIILLFVVGILLNISQNNPDMRRVRMNLRDAARTTLNSRQQARRWSEERLKEIREYTGRNDEA